jgi:diguanylate cyclase (GGDEF)-like protein
MRRVPALLVPGFAAVAGLPAAVAPGSLVAHASYLVCFISVVALGWWRLRDLSGPVRTGYGFIVAALTVWLCGDVLYDVLDRLIGPLGDVSPSDVLWVGGYPLVAIGLVKLVRLRAPGKLREGMLDALAMATVMAWLCWQFLILPAAEHQKLSLPIVFGAFYPLGDVVLFAAAAILMLAPGSKRGPTRYLAAALTLTLVGDVGISMLPTLFPDLSRSVQADRLDGVLLVANSLFIAALWHPQAAMIAEPDSEREQRLHPARVIFLGIALVALPMFAGLQTFTSVLSRVSLLVSIGLLTSLILVRFVLVVREQEYIRAVLAHRAQHDQLTGLANRQALQSGLHMALVRARNQVSAYGPVVFYLDLNGFKQINDRYGHAAGDFVLVEFARRLRTTLRPGEVAARLGGDEFVVLSENVASAADARAIADRLQGLADEPVCRLDEAFIVGVSVGVAAAGDLDAPDTDALLAAADAEMYTEKTRHHREAAAAAALLEPSVR